MCSSDLADRGIDLAAGGNGGEQITGFVELKLQGFFGTGPVRPLFMLALGGEQL